MARGELVCAGCGSTRLRSSRPNGATDRLAAVFGVRFHVCTDCGTRGRHRRRHLAARRRQVVSGGRPTEARDTRATRERAMRQWAAVIVAALLGGAVAFWLASIGARP